MATKSFKFFLHHIAEHSTRTEPFFTLSSASDMSSHGWLMVKEVSVEVEVPEMRELIPQQLAVLEKAKAKVRAEFAARVKEIDDAIGRFLAIENTVEG